VAEGLRTAVRGAAGRFFAEPPAVKQRYAVTVGGRGWLATGVEANAYAEEGGESPPDLKESYSVGADQPIGDPAVDGFWFAENTWPDDEVPELRTAAKTYLAEMRRLADDLLRLLAASLGEPEDAFTRYATHPTHTFNINWYPARRRTGDPQPGQFRIGPHTDFGTVTILERQAGKGGLQIYSDVDGWVDAPHDPAALTVNIGDLMARWTADRWRSGRHRVLPPPQDAPEEELMSLVYFYECDHDAVVTAIGPEEGRRNEYRPVVASAYLKSKLDAITVG
jgi:isopenicillin N synthase-like dioxygenase